MDETGMRGGGGKLIKTEVRLMFVGGILMHSRGDTTPSTQSPPRLGFYIYRYLHPSPD